MQGCQRRSSLSNVALIIEFVPRETFISCGSIPAMLASLIPDSVPVKLKEVLLEQKGWVLSERESLA